MKSYRIPDILEQYVNHDMIQMYTQLPPITDARAIMLFSALVDQKASESVSELYTLVTSLVQLGMDTHDRIDTNEEKLDMLPMRTRQINVLAGDYFSARFYQLLAQAGHIEMIAKISDAVCEINRVKVTLYTCIQENRLTAEQYYDFSVQLRSQLFLHFSSILDDDVANIWSSLVHRVAECEVLIDELERSRTAELFRHSWCYWYICEQSSIEMREQLVAITDDVTLMEYVEKFNGNDQLAAKLVQVIDEVKSLIASLKSEKLRGQLQNVVRRFTDQLDSHIASINEMR